MIEILWCTLFNSGIKGLIHIRMKVADEMVHVHVHCLLLVHCKAQVGVQR